MALPVEPLAADVRRLRLGPGRASRVLVVGAGVAGSAVAASLRQGGVEVDLIEKRERHSPLDGAGVLLPANAVGALTRLGYGPALLDRMLTVPGIVLADSNGVPLACVDCRQQAFPAGTIRHSVLRDILAGDDAAAVLFGVTVAACDPLAHRVRLSNGQDREYDLIIGADGVASSIRQLIFGEGAPTPLGDYAGYRFVIPSQWHLDRPHYLLGNGRTLLLVPLPNGELYCGAGPIDRACLVEGATPLETIRRTYQGFGGIAAEVLESLDERATFIPSTFWNLAAPQWTKGRCALLGDAAHATVPTLAQGCAMALEDVDVLMQSLHGQPDVEAALGAYARRRDARVRFVQRESLRRMAGSRRAPEHESSSRFKLAAAFGADAMSRAWAQLAVERP